MSAFQFQSFNFPDRYIRHHDFLGELSQEVVGREMEFAFNLVDRGHDTQGRRLVSLGSVFPEHLFLRHRDFRLRLEGPSGTADQLFKQDSTFFLEQGLAAPNDQNAVSFRSLNFPDRYIRHRDFHLFVEPRDSPNLVPDATFLKTVRFD
jgi:Alpha-L-arabinofuranosidase B (ABFB) domain